MLGGEAPLQTVDRIGLARVVEQPLQAPMMRLQEGPRHRLAGILEFLQGLNLAKGDFLAK
jgi:hypothetical protein